MLEGSSAGTLRGLTWSVDNRICHLEWHTYSRFVQELQMLVISAFMSDATEFAQRFTHFHASGQGAVSCCEEDLKTWTGEEQLRSGCTPPNVRQGQGKNHLNQKEAKRGMYGVQLRLFMTVTLTLSVREADFQLQP